MVRSVALVLAREGTHFRPHCGIVSSNLVSKSRSETYPQLSPVVLEAAVQINLTGPHLAIFILAAICANQGAKVVDVVTSPGESRGSGGSSREEGEKAEALEGELHYGEL